MYNVSNDYLLAFKKPVHRWRIKGTVGNVAFTDENILTGSFHLSNAASGNDDITLGMVNIGELSATFVGLSINRYSWKNKEITVEIGLTKAGGTVEYVPAGKYTITSAEWSADGVSVVAYDNMRLFDKPFFMQLGAATAYDLLEFACQECGVTFGMADLTGFCNKDLIYPADYGEDIETYRDLIYWVAQTQCAFATIDRTGALVLRRFISSAVDTIDATERYNTSRFADYETHYTGMSIVNTSDGTTQYYSLDPDNGSTINLGSNPLLQRIPSVLEPIIQNMLTEVAQIEYVPFTATMLGGVHYDLGDVLTEAGGIGAGSSVIITGFDYNFNVGFEMVGVGANPKLASANSKSDKNIQSLLATTNKNEFRDYEQKNTGQIVIGNNEEQRICSVRLASNNQTKALIHIQVNLESEADEITDDIDVDVVEDEQITATASGDDIFRLVSDGTTKGIVRYVINSEEIEMKPQEQWLDGKHILHLMYVQPLEIGVPIQFDAYLKAKDGTITIPKGAVWFYGAGRGLVGDGKWDGTFNIQEDAADFSLIEIGIEQAIEGLIIDNPTLIPITASDTAQEFTLQELTFENAADLVFVNLYVGKFDLITEAGEAFTTEDGIALVTEHD